MSSLRMLIVDDHEVVLRGLRVLIEARPGWEVCGEAMTGREAVQKAEELMPDLVVMDIGMPELNGLDATRQILKAAPQTEVLILTVHESEQLVREVLRAGAHGYVLKSAAGRYLVDAIEALSKHQAFFTSSVAKIMLEAYRENRSPDQVGIVLQVEDLELDRVARTVRRAGRGIHLTPREFALLEYFMLHAGECVTREMITEHFSDSPFARKSNILDVYVKYLRDKVDRGFEKQLISTVRGVGYRLGETRTDDKSLKLSNLVSVRN